MTESRAARAATTAAVLFVAVIAALRTAGVFTLATVICDAPGGAR